MLSGKGSFRRACIEGARFAVWASMPPAGLRFCVFPKASGLKRHELTPTLSGLQVPSPGLSRDCLSPRFWGGCAWPSTTPGVSDSPCVPWLRPSCSRLFLSRLPHSLSSPQETPITGSEAPSPTYPSDQLQLTSEHVPSPNRGSLEILLVMDSEGDNIQPNTGKEASPV